MFNMLMEEMKSQNVLNNFITFLSESYSDDSIHYNIYVSPQDYSNHQFDTFKQPHPEYIQQLIRVSLFFSLSFMFRT